MPRLNLFRTRAPAPLLLALAVQVLAAAYFLTETVAEFRSSPDDLHFPSELSMALALIIGITLSIRELRLVLRRADEQASALEIVRDSFARVLRQQFDLWKLTPAEREIAQLSLEGLEVEAIAAARQAAPGTVRAQLARVYAKSGVANRAQLASVFLAELIGSRPDKTAFAPGGPL